jgi:hypothetical protein
VQEVANVAEVGLEHREHGLLGHRLHVRVLVEARVVIGDQGYPRERDPGLRGQRGLGGLGHVDDVPSGVAMRAGLGAAGEAGAVDDHDGAAVDGGHADCFGGVEQGPAQPLVVRFGERRVDRSVLELVVERGLAPPGAVDELVDDDELAGPDLRTQGPCREGRDQGSHAERPHRVHIGAVVDLVRREAVLGAVPGEERDAHALDLGDGDRPARRAPRGVGLDGLDLVGEGVEAGAAEDADVGAGCFLVVQLVLLVRAASRARASCARMSLTALKVPLAVPVTLLLPILGP